MRYFLAADTGGSKTIINVYNENCILQKSYNVSGAGLATDSDDDIPFLSETVKEIALSYDIASVAINLGGKNVNQIKNIFLKHLPEAKIEVFRESEGTAALELGKIFGTEIVLLAGTGAISIGYNGIDSYIVSGGWGANISDDGSGYSIGLTAIRESLKSLDSGLPLSPLQKEITGLDASFKPKTSVKEICKARDEVRANLGTLDRKNIASYTKTVASFAESGEEDALNILKNAGIELAKLIISTANSLKPYTVKGVTVTGGLLKSKKFWQESFENYIKANSQITVFKYVDDGVMLGTLEYAKKLI